MFIVIREWSGVEWSGVEWRAGVILILIIAQDNGSLISFKSRG